MSKNPPKAKLLRIQHQKDVDEINIMVHGGGHHGGVCVGGGDSSGDTDTVGLVAVFGVMEMSTIIIFFFFTIFIQHLIQ